LTSWGGSVSYASTRPSRRSERTEANPLGAYALIPESIRYLSEEELAAKRLDAEDAR
jgi:hypothetical protein